MSSEYGSKQKREARNKAKYQDRQKRAVAKESNKDGIELTKMLR